MDLRRGLIELMSPLGIGDRLPSGARWVDASTDLGLRLSFDRDGQSVHVELTPATESGRHAARTDHLFVSYRSPVHAPVPPPVGLALCREVATVIAPNEVRVLELLRARPAIDQARVREVMTERALEPGVDEGRPFYTVNPYVGCLVGCRFCYAQSRTSVVRRVEGLPDVPWGSYTEVRTNAPERLSQEIEEATPAPLKFCPIVSDAYQPIERKYRVTRRCLEVLARAERPFPPLILTRTNLILEDVDLLARIEGAGAGASIPTIDDEVRAHFEPRAIPIPERLAILRTLRAAGVRAFAVVQPILPGPIEPLADALAETVESVSLEVLRSIEGAAADFDDPRFRHARDPAWQSDRRDELARALAGRGIPTWVGDLPP